MSPLNIPAPSSEESNISSSVPRIKKVSTLKIVVTLLAPLIIVGVILFGTINNVNERNNIMENGLVTVGVPTGNIIKYSHRTSNRTTDKVRVEYKYVVDGQIYTIAGDQHYKRDFFNKHEAIAANPEVEVRYVEGNPAEAIALDKKY